MSMCYVCESAPVSISRNNVGLCCEDCLTSYKLLRSLAETSKKRITAYSDMSLFESVDLSFNDDDDVEGNKSFVLPVCIEAIPHHAETDVIFLVKEKSFSPGKKDCLMFHTVAEANDFIKVLKVNHSDKWAFVVWSYSALVK